MSRSQVCASLSIPKTLPEYYCAQTLVLPDTHIKGLRINLVHPATG